MNFQTMNKQRKFVLIASALGIIAMFLPWVSVSILGMTQSTNGLHDKGILVFICFLACAAMAYLGDQTKNLDKTSWIITLIAPVIVLLMIIWFYSQMSNSFLGASFIGFGVYIAGIAAIGILVSAYLFRSPDDNIKDSFNKLKEDIEKKVSNTNSGSEPPKN